MMKVTVFDEAFIYKKELLTSCFFGCLWATDISFQTDVCDGDKFRAKSKDGRKTISITNYAKPRNGEIINRAFFE
ncbi:MAG: hypothetical protein AAF740_04185, partial [Bacteroidota bacterium]